MSSIRSVVPTSLKLGLLALTLAVAAATAVAGTPSAGAAAPATLPVSRLTIKPGAIGPVTIGTSKKHAIASGYFVRGTPPNPQCAAPPLVWRSPYAARLDVITVGNGEIRSLGVRSQQPRTKRGLGVGTTYGHLRKFTGLAPEEAGFGQTGVYIHSSYTGGYIGFLFDTPVDGLRNDSRVTFVEVTKNEKPSLVRSGC